MSGCPGYVLGPVAPPACLGKSGTFEDRQLLHLIIRELGRPSYRLPACRTGVLVRRHKKGAGRREEGAEGDQEAPGTVATIDTAAAIAAAAATAAIAAARELLWQPGGL